VYYTRVAAVVARALTRPRLGILDETVVHLRVWPEDLDFNLHMNNSRYFDAMELARFDLIARQRWVPMLLRQRWGIMVGGSTIRYRRPLRAFERFASKTRFVGWDEKWFFIEHRLENSDGDLAAQAAVKGLCRGGRRNVPAAEALEAMGFATESPPLPEWIAAWAEASSAG
jgi:acyl-CoA thioesterase FadM